MKQSQLWRLAEQWWRDGPKPIRELTRLLEESRAENRQMTDRWRVSYAELTEEIDNRDEAIEWADRLAYAIGPQSTIGEHSSGNNPWQNALDYLDGERQLADLRLEQLRAKSDEVDMLRGEVLEAQDEIKRLTSGEMAQYYLGLQKRLDELESHRGREPIPNVRCKGSSRPGGLFSVNGRNGVTCQVCARDFFPPFFPLNILPEHYVQTLED